VWDYDLTQQQFDDLLAGRYEDGVLNRDWAAVRLIEWAPTGFYLTGGTAVSRLYLHHRFSDDLTPLSIMMTAMASGVTRSFLHWSRRTSLRFRSFCASNTLPGSW
jgi:hypothetical protein